MIQDSLEADGCTGNPAASPRYCMRDSLEVAFIPREMRSSLVFGKRYPAQSPTDHFIVDTRSIQ